MRNRQPLKIILFVFLGALVVLFGVNFILGTTMSKETATKLTASEESGTPDSLKLIYPKDDPSTREKLSGTKPLIHLLMVNEKDIFIYRNELAQGEWISYQNVEAVLRQESAEKRDLVVIITPFPEASYKNTVDMLDQMTINKIKNFLLTEPKKDEMKFIEENPQH